MEGKKRICWNSTQSGRPVTVFTQGVSRNEYTSCQPQEILPWKLKKDLWFSMNLPNINSSLPFNFHNFPVCYHVVNKKKLFFKAWALCNFLLSVPEVWLTGILPGSTLLFARSSDSPLWPSFLIPHKLSKNLQGQAPLPNTRQDQLGPSRRCFATQLTVNGLNYN